MPLFLALARFGALQAAADQLDVNRTTVARRLNALEQKVGAKLFTGDAGRYMLTPVGRELLAVAEAAEAALYKSESLLFGDNAGRGPLRITVPPHLMQIAAPLFIRLAQEHPAFEIDIVATYALEAIEAREADLALRFLRKPPQFPLYGRMLRPFFGAIYRACNSEPDGCVAVVRHGEVAIPNAYRRWRKDAPALQTDDIWVKQELIAAGGIGRLPTFMGDADPRLERASDLLPDAGWKLWLVTQDAFRASPRLRIVTEEISTFFLDLREL